MEGLNFKSLKPASKNMLGPGKDRDSKCKILLKMRCNPQVVTMEI